MPRLPKLIAAFVTLAVLILPSGCMYKQAEAVQAAPRTPDEKRVIQDFKKRVDRYEDLSEKFEKEVYPHRQELDANEIHKKQKELAARILKALPDWKQGNIFTPEMAEIFKRRI